MYATIRRYIVFQVNMIELFKSPISFTRQRTLLVQIVQIAFCLMANFKRELSLYSLLN